jgi:prepilin-type processing-associated H-X9-DG protein
MQRGSTQFGNANSSWGPGKGPVFAFMGTASGSYGMNGFLNIPTVHPPSPTTAAQYYSFPVSGDASRIPLFGDAIWFIGYPNRKDSPPANSTFGQPLGSGVNTFMYYFATNRHSNKTVNMAFVDGHVDNLPLSDLWGLNWSVGYVAPVPLPVVTN